MTTGYIDTNNIGPGARLAFLAAGDEFVILPGVTVASTTTFATSMSLADLQLIVSGTLAGTSLLITGPGNSLRIGPSGQVLALATSPSAGAVTLAGAGSSITNDGQIIANQSIAVLMNGSAIDLQNTGSISGATGVFIFLTGGNRFINAGTVTASGYQDAGFNERFNNAVFVEATNTLVTNLAGGDFIAVSTTGSGARFGGNAGGGVLQNDGVITSAQDFGVNLGTVTAGQSLIRVMNSGTITGFDGAYNGSVNADVLVNSGILRGDVFLGAGADVFEGRGGKVVGTVFGGAGDDQFIVSDAGIVISEAVSGGTDTLRSTVSITLANNVERLVLLGTDDLRGYGTSANDIITGNAGDNRITGNAGNDLISGLDGDDRLRGHNGNDTLYGGDGDDWILGNAGLDTLSGGEGDDQLYGGPGSDLIYGGDGADTLIGGAGRDTLAGNGGADHFVFETRTDSPTAASDRISGFVKGEDKIDLSELVTGSFAFRGTGILQNGPAQVQLRETGGSTFVRIDLNGDRLIDMQIFVTAQTGLHASDFIL